jgi:HEAT repeat protein
MKARLNTVVVLVVTACLVLATAVVADWYGVRQRDLAQQRTSPVTGGAGESFVPADVEATAGEGGDSQPTIPAPRQLPEIAGSNVLPPTETNDIAAAVEREMQRREANPDQPPPQEQNGIIAELAEIELGRRANERATREDIPEVRETLAKLETARYEERADLCRRLLERTPDARRLAEPKLRELLSDPFPLVQVAAAGVLYSLDQDQSVTQVVVGHLDDIDAEVRRRAAWQLAYQVGQRDPGTVEPLIAALADSHYEVRQLAAAALSRRHQIAGPAIPALLVALGDESEIVRMSAAGALGGIRPLASEVVPALIDAVDDPSESVHREVFEALAKIGSEDDRVLPFLLGLLDGSDLELVELGLGALEDMRAEEALPYAERLENSRDEGVARAARRVLRYVGGRVGNTAE